MEYYKEKYLALLKTIQQIADDEVVENAIAKNSPKKSFCDKILEKKIKDLEWGLWDVNKKRVCDGLHLKGILTIKDLIKHNPSHYLSFDKIGEGSVNRLMEVLEENNVIFSKDKWIVREIIDTPVSDEFPIDVLRYLKAGWRC